ncbi:MAG: hypothetical protein M3R55_03140 [Acidobacteriota bacterium]|nr:hypothetical protein [Acidobacteriota bacterium]
MTMPIACGDELVELFFYGELGADDRVRAHAHISGCRVCQESLADLRAIDAALAERAVAAPDGGDWSGFMARLDTRLGAGRVTPPAAAPRQPWLQMAAAVLLIATGALGGWMLSRFPSQASAVTAAGATQADHALADAGDSGLERARMVLAGLAQKEDGAPWSLERGMAASLLPEVTLIRQAAAARGRADLEDILKDVETLLMQASYAETDDAQTLARLRGMIDRRDLLMRLSVEKVKTDS